MSTRLSPTSFDTEAMTTAPQRFVISPRLRKAGGPYIGPRGGKWADPKHTIPWKPARSAPAPGLLITGLKTADIPQKVAELERRPRSELEGFRDRIEQRKKQLADVGVPVNLIRWGRVVQMALDNQKTRALSDALPPPAEPEPEVAGEHTEAAQAQGGQLGFIFRESTAEPEAVEPVGGEQEQTGAGDGGLSEEALTPATPTKPKGAPASTESKRGRADKPKPSGRGSRRKHVEVGAHVYGSRADLAVPRSSGDLAKLTPSDQKRYVKKSKLLPPLDPQAHLDSGRTPGYVLMRDALEKCVQSAPADSQRARELFMDGVDFVTRSLDGCNSAQDITAFVQEWHYLARGEKLIQELSTDEIYKKRDAWLAKRREGKGAGISSSIRSYYSTDLPMTHAEWKAGQRELEQINTKLSELIKKYGGSAPGEAPEVKAVVDQRTQLRRKLNEYEQAGGPLYNVWALVLTGSEHGASFERKPDGTVRVFERDHIAGGIKDNKYAQMAAALGKRMINVVGKHGPEHSGPKAFKDAARQVRKWRREEAAVETQESQLFEILGKKRKAGERKRRFVWQRQVTGKPIRKGGRPVAGPDAERMAKDFALKNVQFGNWVSDEDAAAHLEAAHGALFDLADVMGIAPERVSLGGRLALAIGARGVGGPMAAAAHYETGKEIINLTKFAGGGTLAHEWGHAMDNILAKHANPGSTAAGLFLSEGQTGEADPELIHAYERVMDTMTWSDEETARSARRLDALTTRWKLDPRSLSSAERAEVRQLGSTALGRKRSEFMQVSAGLTTSTNSYWTRPHEMFARCFEAYVQDQLEDNGRLNSYLVDGTRTPNPKLGRELHPYPMGEERKRINAAFEHLLSVMREGKHLEKALRALFGLTEPDLYVIPVG